MTNRSTLDDSCPFARILADRLRESKRDLTAKWLDRISERISLEPNKVFPTDELLNHVPLLIEGIADTIADQSSEIAMDMPVIAKAMELGELRHRQGFDAYEILKEYEFLGGILFYFFRQVVESSSEPCTNGELIVCSSRLYRALTIIQQSTMTHFLLLSDKKVAEKEDRLRAFNRVISHEIKNRVGAMLGAGDLLAELPDMSADKRQEFVDIVRRNARELRTTVENVMMLARAGEERAGDPRAHRHVMLQEAIREAVRSIRDAAQAAGIDVRVAPDIPDVEVNAAVIELAIRNYLSNAVKYADTAKQQRFVEVTAREEQLDKGRELVVRVRDNGLGVPVDKRDKLFGRFFRAHETITGIEGTGLGLSIVREISEQQGGRAWAEYLDDGSIFAIALPLRRQKESPTDRRAGSSKEMERQSAVELRTTN